MRWAACGRPRNGGRRGGGVPAKRTSGIAFRALGGDEVSDADGGGGMSGRIRCSGKASLKSESMLVEAVVGGSAPAIMKGPPLVVQ